MMMEQDIIEVLSNEDRPAMSAIEINDALGFSSIEDYKKLECKLDEMSGKGILYYSEKKRRYLLLKNSHLMKGKLLVNPKGFGFVEIGTAIGFVGLFTFLVMSKLSKHALAPKHHPLLDESLHHQI